MEQQIPTPEDVQQNKPYAILAYFIFFLPLIVCKDSPYGKYHSNQGLLLLIACFALGIVQAILGAIFLFMPALWGVFALIFTLVYIGLAVLGILGIVNAAQGKMAPMPLIGNLFTLIK